MSGHLSDGRTGEAIADLDRALDHLDHPVAYLDHAATSPLRPEALAAMLPYLAEQFGNPSGSHSVARRARQALEEARDSVADMLGADPAEVVFTGGGTESCNLALLGAHGILGGAVRASAVEHPAVRRPCEATGRAEWVAVDRSGRLDLDALATALGPEVRLVSVMTANNETGVLQPLAEAAEVVRSRAPEAVLHTDAVGAGAWVELAEHTAPADLVSIGAHKFGGPKGAGVLVARRGTRLAPVLHGGPQERDRRPGTHDVAGVVGMAAALRAATAGRAEEARRVAALRDELADGLLGLPGVHETAARRTPAGTPDRSHLLPGTLHLRFGGVDQQELLVLLDHSGVCASAGASCSSGALEPSRVLLAMGLSSEESRGALRFSLGWTTTEADVGMALAAVPKALERLRA